MKSLLKKVDTSPDHAAYHAIKTNVYMNTWHHTLEKIVFESGSIGIRDSVYQAYCESYAE